MKLILIGLLLLSLPLSAANDVQKQRQEVEAALSMLQQEQQNLFQQFQMLQELRRQELLQENSIIMQQSQPIVGNAMLNYDEVQKREQERLVRIKDYSARLNEIHERYQEIDRERQVMINELTALRQGKSPDREEMD
ncbi:MAG: hypothetical protein WAT53_06240 [Nitrosomonas sp.]|jgi:hypothetical protein|nr:hypothetical protein [Nitrosomonas sp.]MCC7136011.1 hypothetical protein [Nitrosomonas sp.]